MRFVPRLPAPRIGRVSTLLLSLALGAVGGLIAIELHEGRLQARAFSDFAAQARYRVEPGMNLSITFPKVGPRDRRLGYVRLPQSLNRLRRKGGHIEAQARWSGHLRWFAQNGLFPAYAEVTDAGLEVLDRAGRPIFSGASATRRYTEFAQVPRAVAGALLFIENRELLDTRIKHRNPAVEWTRLLYASAQAALRVVQPDRKVPGASTLATQMEKFRHADGGRTHSAVGKLKQMASATLRAYRSGPNTAGARAQIVVDYLNSVPLGATATYGEITGFAAGLRAWFGADFDRLNDLLVDADRIERDDPRLGEAAVALRQTLALLVGLRRPRHFLKDDREATAALSRRYLPQLAQAGIISKALSLAAANATLVFQTGAAPEQVVSADRKAADRARLELLGALDVDRLYTLDRLHVSARTTVDLLAQRAVSEAFAALQTPEGVAAAGLDRTRLLAKGDPARVDYSFTLYERVGDRIFPRVQTDTAPGQFSLTDGMKVELGSTAKARVMVSWLSAMADVWQDRSGAERDPRDLLSRWVDHWASRHPQADLSAMLLAAMERRFSANPNVDFVTGGGVQRFHNFNPDDDDRKPTARASIERSINLPMVRIMRELTRHFVYRDGSASALLQSLEHPGRRPLLKRFALQEGAVFIRRFYRRAHGQDGIEQLAARVGPEPERLSVLFRAVRPAASKTALGRFLVAHDAAVDEADLSRMFERYGRLSAQDQGYLCGLHPLELWTVRALRQTPNLRLPALLAQSRAARLEAYAWLLDSKKAGAQNRRLRTMLEQDAFQLVLAQWQRMGYPFQRIVPSLGTALGSSGDRPSALAEFMGILSAGGVRYPIQRITRLRFAQGTPYETIVRPGLATQPERVLRAEVAQVARETLMGVVSRGTARRAQGAFGGGALRLGGKTGTGDNRQRIFSGGKVVGERVHSRSATFMFVAGARFFGVITAHVEGEVAAEFDFTSALPVRILRRLGPMILPAFSAPAVQGHTQAEGGSRS